MRRSSASRWTSSVRVMQRALSCCILYSRFEILRSIRAMSELLAIPATVFIFVVMLFFSPASARCVLQSVVRYRCDKFSKAPLIVHTIRTIFEDSFKPLQSGYLQGFKIDFARYSSQRRSCPADFLGDLLRPPLRPPATILLRNSVRNLMFIC